MRDNEKETKEEGTMTKIDYYNSLKSSGHGFMANVIFCHHSNPAMKLRGLFRLVSSGRNVRLADFNMDLLILDGKVISFKSLEGVK